MSTLRLSICVFSFLLLTFFTDAVLIAGQSCRSAGARVLYDTYSSDVDYPFDCTILRVIPKDAVTTVTIACTPPTKTAFSLESSPNWESKDGGHTWHKALDDVPAQFPRILFQPVLETNTQYRYIEDLGLYLRSDDGGKTWFLPEYRINGISRWEFMEQFDNGRFQRRNYAVDLAIVSADAHDPLKLYAEIGFVPWGVMLDLSNTLDPRSPQALTLPGLYESSDGGESWKKSLEGPSRDSPLGISPSDPKVMFAMGTKAVIKSENGGQDWGPVGQNAELTTKPLIKIHQYSKSGKSANEEFTVSQLTVDPENSNVVFIVSNKGFFRSLNGGKTWCLLNLGFDELDAARNLIFNMKKPQEIFLGTRRGVFHSLDEGNHIEKLFPPHNSKEK